MTIIAGFKCYEGIVICSDTQETISNLSKRNIPKLRFEPSGGSHSGDGLAAAFCGAGDNGSFIDKLIETAWIDAQCATSIDEACEEVEKSIANTYRKFGRIYQPGYCPGADLIYGIKMHNSSRLFNAHDAVVTEKHGYETAGIGYYMADFIAGRMYADHLNLYQCVILAAYILFQAKEHVDGCGGESHIAILRDKGVSGPVDYRRVNRLTTLLQFADFEAGRMLLKVAELGLDEKEFREEMDEIVNSLKLIRDSNREKIEKDDEWNKTFSKMHGIEETPKDSFGLPLLSDGEQEKGS